MFIAGRHTMFKGGVKFIAAAQSDGTACIVVPHVQQNVNDAKVRIVFRRPLDISSSGPIMRKNLFGYSKNDSLWGLNNYNDINDGAPPVKFQIYSAAFVNNTNTTPWSNLTANAFNEVIVQRVNGYVSMFFNGTQQFSKAQSGTPVKGRYGLLTQNDAEGDAVNPIAGRAPAGVPVSEFDTWDGGVLVTSLRPCRDRSGTVCFYDLVSRQYIYSATGGTFSEAS